ncbi:MAG: hypothetical protein AB1540_11460 [Bdellovibrionota bacterium]
MFKTGLFLFSTIVLSILSASDIHAESKERHEYMCAIGCNGERTVVEVTAPDLLNAKMSASGLLGSKKGAPNWLSFPNKMDPSKMVVDLEKLPACPLQGKVDISLVGDALSVKMKGQKGQTRFEHSQSLQDIDSPEALELYFLNDSLGVSLECKSQIIGHEEWALEVPFSPAEKIVEMPKAEVQPQETAKVEAQADEVKLVETATSAPLITNTASISRSVTSTLAPAKSASVSENLGDLDAAESSTASYMRIELEADTASVATETATVTQE